MVYESPSLPMYFKIKRVITNRISDGTYPLQMKIPGEHELSEEFGVNRQTVRHALSLLTKEGYLERFRKRGTFVSKNATAFEELKFEGLFDDLLFQVRRFKTRKVEFSDKKPSQAIAKLFQIDPNKQKVKVIKRVRFLGNRPAAYTVNYLPLDIGNLIRKEDLYKMPLLQIFKEKLQISLGEAFQTIEASVAIDDIAKALKISPGSQLLLTERTFFTKEGKPFDFVQTFYRGDRIRYCVRLRYEEKGNSLLVTR